MIIVQYILPALRVAIAKELIEKFELRKIDVADKMNVTPAAITQYMKRSRGDTASLMIERSGNVKDLVSDISRDLAEKKSPPDVLLMKLCRACRAVRSEGLICDLHKEAMPSLRQVETCACSLGLVGWDR
jgi:predicted transcriptional regulator